MIASKTATREKRNCHVTKSNTVAEHARRKLALPGKLTSLRSMPPQRVYRSCAQLTQMRSHRMLGGGLHGWRRGQLSNLPWRRYAGTSSSSSNVCPEAAWRRSSHGRLFCYTAPVDSGRRPGRRQRLSRCKEILRGQRFNRGLALHRRSLGESGRNHRHADFRRPCQAFRSRRNSREYHPIRTLRGSANKPRSSHAGRSRAMP